MSDFIKIKLSQTNCYLIKGEKGYILIDCGKESDKDNFLKKLNKLKINLNEINYLILTHHHNDHCGLLCFLTSANPFLKVLMSKRCAEILGTGRHYHADGEHYSNKFLKLIMKIILLKSSEEFRPYVMGTNDIIISDDSEVQLSDLEYKIKIINTKGHTEDSISVITGNIAFVGDAICNILNFTGIPYLPIMLYSKNEYYKSLTMLRNENIELVCPAHGKPCKLNKILSL